MLGTYRWPSSWCSSSSRTLAAQQQWPSTHPPNPSCTMPECPPDSAGHHHSGDQPSVGPGPWPNDAFTMPPTSDCVQHWRTALTLATSRPTSRTTRTRIGIHHPGMATPAARPAQPSQSRGAERSKSSSRTSNRRCMIGSTNFQNTSNRCTANTKARLGWPWSRVHSSCFRWLVSRPTTLRSLKGPWTKRFERPGYLEPRGWLEAPHRPEVQLPHHHGTVREAQQILHSPQAQGPQSGSKLEDYAGGATPWTSYGKGSQAPTPARSWWPQTLGDTQPLAITPVSRPEPMPQRVLRCLPIRQNQTMRRLSPQLPQRHGPLLWQPQSPWSGGPLESHPRISFDWATTTVKRGAKTWQQPIGNFPWERLPTGSPWRFITPKGPTLWRHHCLSFGATGSVWGFNRAADFCFLTRQILVIPACHYVDDFASTEPKHTAQSSYDAFGGVSSSRHGHETGQGPASIPEPAPLGSPDYPPGRRFGRLSPCPRRTAKDHQQLSLRCWTSNQLSAGTGTTAGRETGVPAVFATVWKCGHVQPYTPSMDEQPTMKDEIMSISPMLFEPPSEHSFSTASPKKICFGKSNTKAGPLWHGCKLSARWHNQFSPSTLRIPTKWSTTRCLNYTQWLGLCGHDRWHHLLQPWHCPPGSLEGLLLSTGLHLLPGDCSSPLGSGGHASPGCQGKSSPSLTTSRVKPLCWRATVVTPPSTTFWQCIGQSWVDCNWTFIWNGSRATSTSVMQSAVMTFDKLMNFSGNYGGRTAPGSFRCCCGQAPDLDYACSLAADDLLSTPSTELSGWAGLSVAIKWPLPLCLWVLQHQHHTRQKCLRSAAVCAE